MTAAKLPFAGISEGRTAHGRPVLFTPFHTDVPPQAFNRVRESSWTMFPVLFLFSGWKPFEEEVA